MYKVIDKDNILGQGCSSVVKLCVLQDQKRDNAKSGRRVYQKHESSPLLNHIMAKV